MHVHDNYTDCLIPLYNQVIFHNTQGTWCWSSLVGSWTLLPENMSCEWGGVWQRFHCACHCWHGWAEAGSSRRLQVSFWLGRAWASPTLVWLHCTRACVCMFVCLRPYTKNFKWACLNFNITKIELRVWSLKARVQSHCYLGGRAMKVACLPNTCSASDIPIAKTRIGQRATKETVLAYLPGPI